MWGVEPKRTFIHFELTIAQRSLSYRQNQQLPPFHHFFLCNSPPSPLRPPNFLPADSFRQTNPYALAMYSQITTVSRAVENHTLTLGWSLFPKIRSHL